MLRVLTGTGSDTLLLLRPLTVFKLDSARPNGQAEAARPHARAPRAEGPRNCTVGRAAPPPGRPSGRLGAATPPPRHSELRSVRIARAHARTRHHARSVPSARSRGAAQNTTSGRTFTAPRLIASTTTGSASVDRSPRSPCGGAAGAARPGAAHALCAVRAAAADRVALGDLPEDAAHALPRTVFGSAGTTCEPTASNAIPGPCLPWATGLPHRQVRNERAHHERSTRASKQRRRRQRARHGRRTASD